MNAVADHIAREIWQNGPMTLARFMELALYLPGRGYYETQQEIGQRGDFYTNVSVGSLFGELLAFQFAAWLEQMPRCSIVEVGAHQGRLAADILSWLEHFRPGLFARIEYILIEPSATHRGWQSQTLKTWGGHVRWIDAVQELPINGVFGIVFSNEFFDASPMHRLGWNAGTQTWREWRVIEDNGRFGWNLGNLSRDVSEHLPHISPEVAKVLPDQFTVEVSPWAQAWWKRAAESLHAGTLLTFDYGFVGDEWLRPQHQSGALRGYVGHHLASNPLDNPGAQDLTAHINFSALQEAGETAGLRSEGIWTQSTFLTRIFARSQTEPSTFAEWSPARTRQFQTLTHLEHLGRAFRVLEQSRITQRLDQPPTY